MGKLTSLNKISDLRRWVRTSCHRAKIKAEFMDGIPGPYTNRKSIVIPTFTNDMTEVDEAKIRFFVLHECSHHNEGPEYFDVMEHKGITMQHPIGVLSNIIEDQRIERNASRRYEGDRLIISDGREIMGGESLAFIKKLAKKLTPDELAEDSCRMQAAFAVATTAQAHWCPGAALHIREEVSTATSAFPRIGEYAERLFKSGAVTSIHSLKDGEGSFELAKKWYQLLWDKDDEQLEEELKKMQQEAADGDGEESDEKKKGKKGKAGDPSVTDKVGEPDKGEVDPRTGEYRIKYKYFVKSQHEKPDPHDPGGHGLGLDYTGYKATGKFTPEDFDHMRVIDYGNGHEPVRRGSMRSWGGNEDRMKATTAFANRVRRFLQVNSEDHYIGGQRKGNIHTRTLYRAGVPQIGDGDWNKKVFRVKDESDVLDTSVSVLVDMSGSMCGIKTVHATQSAMLLNHVISNTLRINTEILTFSWSSQTIIGNIKTFGSRVSDDDIFTRFEDFTGYMWGNDDADAILYARDRLLKQNTKRKVLIVLSDGSPADGIGDTDPYYALRETVKEIEQSKECDIIGIGIMDSSVRDFYKRYTIIKTASELEDGLLKVISNNIMGDK